MNLFQPGDIISFVCKDASYGMAKVLRIDDEETLPVPEKVYHFLIFSLRNLFPPNEAYLSDAKPFIPHLAILESGVIQSKPNCIAFQEVSNNELQMVEFWRSSFYAGESGVFELAIDEAIALMLEALGKG